MSKKKTRKEKIEEQKRTGQASASKAKEAAHLPKGTPKSKKANKKKAKIRNNKWSATTLLPILAVLAITAIVFSTSLDNEFVNWDDDKNFSENEYITSLNSENFWDNTCEIFSNPVIGNYNPLTIWTFLLENKFFGLDQPFYWHLNNLLLHLICVWLVYCIGIRLKLDWKAAALLAILFGIHPLRVESVAWVTERKDVLFGAFYLSALLYYIKSHQTNKKYIIPIICFFILSLLSKIQAVVLPLSMLCVDYLLKSKISWKDVINKWYYFALSLGAGILGLYFLKDQGSLESTTTFPIWQRFFIGSYSYLIYLIKSIVPYRMSPLYPYPSSFPALFYPTLLIVPALGASLWWAHKKQFKAIVFGLVFFTFNIMFLLQILGAGQGFIADRFTYISYFGLFYIYAYYFQKLTAQGKWKLPVTIISSLALVAYAYLTFNQNKIWKNSGTLWTHVIKYYANTTLPFGNRANYYRDNGEIQKALADYSTRIKLKPNEAAPYNSRGRLYFNSSNQDDWLKALSDYSKAIELDPSDAEYYTNRGAIYAKMNNIEAAIKDLNKGVELNPNHAVAYLNRSLMFNMIGDIPKALSDIQSYLRLNPYHADLWYESGRCRRQLKQEAEAIQDFSKAIKYDNSKGLYYYERCKSYIALGKKLEARRDYDAAKQLNVVVDPAFLQFMN